MDLSLKLQTFEGPLDLLLHLIEKNKVDIMNIPIAQITDQYMEYLTYMEQSGQTNVSEMSDFLVMAATLLDIKARLLLPPEKNEEGEELDPRSELVEKLLEYKMYKSLSYELKGREDEAAMLFFHAQKLPAEVKNYREPVDLDLLLRDVTLAGLRRVFLDVMKRQEDRKDPIHGSFGTIEKEDINAGEVMRTVEKRIMRRKKCTFRSLLTMKPGKTYVVVTFLTILELMRMGRVDAVQEDAFGEIFITVRDRSEWNNEYESTGEEELASYD